MLRFLFITCVAAGLLLDGSTTWGAKRERKSLAEADLETVELFAAIDAGQIEVKFIPKDSTVANVIIKNKQDKPLRIAMPGAFAAVPILAQRGGQGPVGPGPGGGGGNNSYGGNSGQSNSSQGLGGGFGGGLGGIGGGLGGGLGGLGGGFFDVASEATAKMRVTTVCLEHGKPDPSPRIPYEIKPIESFTDNEQVIELCRMLGRGEVDQLSAQAAAWHLASGLSWDELATKVKERYRTGAVRLYFTPVQIRKAALTAQHAAARVAQREQQEVASPGELGQLESPEL